jgi:hypothetical protein
VVVLQCSSRHPALRRERVKDHQRTHPAPQDPPVALRGAHDAPSPDHSLSPPVHRAPGLPPGRLHAGPRRVGHRRHRRPRRSLHRPLGPGRSQHRPARSALHPGGQRRRLLLVRSRVHRGGPDPGARHRVPAVRQRPGRAAPARAGGRRGAGRRGQGAGGRGGGRHRWRAVLARERLGRRHRRQAGLVEHHHPQQADDHRRSHPGGLPQHVVERPGGQPRGLHVPGGARGHRVLRTLLPGHVGRLQRPAWTSPQGTAWCPSSTRRSAAT